MSKRIKWTDQQVKQIIRLYVQQRKTQRQLAKMYGIGRTTIRQIFTSYGETFRTNPESNKIQLSQENISDIIRLYTVQNKSSKYIGQIYGISLYTVLRVLKNNNIQIKRATQASRFKKLNQQAFAQKTPNMCYWIGFLITDGNVSDKNRIKLSISSTDQSHVHQFKKFMGSQHKICEIKKKQSNYNKQQCIITQLSFNSEIVSKDIAKHGVTPRKTFNTKASEQMVLDRDFWRGCIDGDGSLTYSKQKPKRYGPIISLAGSLSLIQQFHTFVKSIINEYRGNIVKNKSIFQMTITGQQAVTLIKHLYNGAQTALPRKMQKAQRIIQQDWKTLKHQKQLANTCIQNEISLS